jgi:hypothetical protein
MHKAILTLILTVGSLTNLNAQAYRDAENVAPTGKGWGTFARNANPLRPAATKNGISYHGGQVMRGNPVNIYFIWYGDWMTGPMDSNSQSTIGLLNSLFAKTGGIGNSGYFRINTTYSGSNGSATGNIALAASTTDYYSKGKQLSDAAVKSVVGQAITSKTLPKDTNAIYFVLTSSDVAETSGFCSKYCGWHNHALIAGTDIKFAFVGNTDRCGSACEAQHFSPNGNPGADGMASIMAHEAAEAVTDPQLNAWYDAKGYENADKCAWKYGPIDGVMGAGAYNQTFGGYNWLLQMNWENARGGGCAQTLGGQLYSN